MDLIVISDTQKEQIRKFFKVSERSVKEDIDRIRSWMTKQSHLPQNLTDDFIEKNLLRNKFRVERTKQKLDNYYSLRGSNVDLIRSLENIVPSEEATTYLPLPKNTPNFERVILIKLNNADLYEMERFIAINLAMAELSVEYDYSIGAKYCVDLEGWNLKHILKSNPITLNKHVGFMQQAYSSRILGIELVNAPAILDNILGVMKLILSPKIYDRVRIHKDFESLHKVIPKECLPEEYGGTLDAVPELLKKWDKVMMEHKEFFLETYKNVSTEHLRLSETKLNDSFGINGTFKQLQLD